MQILADLFSHRSILYSSVVQGVLKKTSGNALGLFWLVLYPVLFLGMYSIVFVHILQVKVPGSSPVSYVLMIFSGLVPFLAFAEAFGAGATSIVANRDLVMNTLFPIELVVARDVLVGHITMGVGMLLLLAGAAYFHGIHWAFLLIPLIYILQIIMILGVVWLVATLTVFFRDIQQAVPIVVLFLMMVSPIGYSAEMVPENLKGFLWANPLAWFIELYRACLLDGVFPFKDLAIVAVSSIASFTLGGAFIRRLKPLFSDYV
ncbi:MULTISPECIES: ABC transporter permease [Delftia]|uniref:ABC transporter permease n=1 Tax=Delftia TaxID=80865 RepID=UPI00064052E3|nr:MULTISPECIES: ABC transporter permease [Delftia]MBK0111370.1 ABC transporter permease [Delftia sp. S65]MBK0116811.1 ABC transporter permease [Delftia sp. S67]MBK0128088.1 ABC transporter permease [Delftia sp. S66]